MTTPRTELTSDYTVGRLVQPPMQAQVSVRGDKIIVQFSNQETQRGVELTFSAQAAEQLHDILEHAVRVARGTTWQ